MNTISIVTPCFNEEQGIRGAYEQLEISSSAYRTTCPSISFATMRRRIEPS